MRIRSITSFTNDKKLQIHYEWVRITTSPLVTRSHMHIFERKNIKKAIAQFSSMKTKQPTCLKINNLFHYLYPDDMTQTIYLFCTDQFIPAEFSRALYGPIRSFVLGASNVKSDELVAAMEKMIEHNLTHLRQEEEKVFIGALVEQKNLLWKIMEEKRLQGEDIAELEKNYRMITESIDSTQSKTNSKRM